MRGGNAEKDDMNAAMIEHFEPVTMTLPEIEAMQATFSELAAWHRREEEGKPEDPLTDFVELLTKDLAPVDDCMDVNGFGDPVEELGPYDPEEDDWRGLDTD